MGPECGFPLLISNTRIAKNVAEEEPAFFPSSSPRTQERVYQK